MRRKREKKNVFGRFVLTILFIGLIGIAAVQTLRYEDEKAKVERYKIELQDFENIELNKKDTWNNKKEQELNAAKSRIAELEIILNQEGKAVEVPENVNQNSERETKSNSNYDEFIKTKFKFDGNFYSDLSTAKFYKDLNCTQEIEGSIRLISSEIDEITLNNEKKVYCLLMDNEEMCYTTEYPMIMTEKEYLEHVHFLN